jgi:hypothetical protein
MKLSEEMNEFILKMIEIELQDSCNLEPYEYIKRVYMQADRHMICGVHG